MIIKKTNKIINKIKVYLLKLFSGRNINFGKKLNIRRGFVANVNGGKLTIGDNVFFNRYCSVNCQEKIDIGDNCLFGENVKIYDHNHVFSDLEKPIYQQGMKKGKVKIGNNCWVGSNSVILMNVNIGDNVVIGANSLIYKDVPSNTIVKSVNTLQYTTRE